MLRGASSNRYQCSRNYVQLQGDKFGSNANALNCNGKQNAQCEERTSAWRAWHGSVPASVEAQGPAPAGRGPQERSLQASVV